MVSANAAAKASSVVGGMLAGADSIDDLYLLRHGGMPRLFSGVRTPSTLGTFLRSFTHGHVQQLDAVGGDLLAGLTARVPGMVAGADCVDGFACIDVDDTIREVHGYAKQAATSGYSGVRGLNIQLATIATPLTAPVIARARLRKGSTASARGAGRLLAQAITTARAAGVRGRIMCRAESAYYGWAFVGTAHPKQDLVLGHRPNAQSATTATASIAEDDWVAIKYPHAIWEEAEQRWISDGEAPRCRSPRSPDAARSSTVTCRRNVRRGKRPQRRACDAPSSVSRSRMTAARRRHNSTLGLVGGRSAAPAT